MDQEAAVVSHNVLGDHPSHSLIALAPDVDAENTQGWGFRAKDRAEDTCDWRG